MPLYLLVAGFRVIHIAQRVGHSLEIDPKTGH
jgi:hypothetical protein